MLMLRFYARIPHRHPDWAYMTAENKTIGAPRNMRHPQNLYISYISSAKWPVML